MACYSSLFINLFLLFSEGRNRKLQGLAGAILTLWEKSPIVKIAIKWGIPNTNNEQMANELKASLFTKFHVVNMRRCCRVCLLVYIHG